ncbi:MAG: AAA family ATPase [Lachnospiraceae bacterium]|nr:AAA family ATPase [Lachnospiraceae bacterium]
MRHFDEIKRKALDYVSGHTIEENKYYVIRDVFGKIAVYIQGAASVDFKQYTYELEQQLGKEWCGQVSKLKETDLIYKEICDTVEKYRNNVYFGERPLVKKSWNRLSRIKTETKAKVVTFYSYKGGVGRTTTLALTALQMARAGKKVVAVDFDLEAPGLSTVLKENGEYPSYGVVDFLVESDKEREEIDIREYVYPITSKALLGLRGGEVYVMQAMDIRSEIGTNYYSKLSRIDFNMPKFFQKNGAIDFLLQEIDKVYKPDYILIDARAGIHDIGGLAMLKYSDEAVLVFYGNQQNMQGLKFVLPKLVKMELPFYLLNSPAPVNEEEEREEIGLYAQTSLEVLEEAEYFEEGTPELFDNSSPHYPLSVYYDELLTNLNSPLRLNNVLEQKGAVYQSLADKLMDGDQDFFTQNFSAKDKNDMLMSIKDMIQTPSADNQEITYETLQREFYPLQEYKYIFEQSKFLITGAKGTGKTQLFNVLKCTKYIKGLAKYLNESENEIENTAWVVGMDEARDFPSPYNFDAVGDTDDIKMYSMYWKILLIKTLEETITKFEIPLPGKIKDVLELKYSEITLWMTNHTGMDEQLWAFLEEVDSELENKQKQVIIIYDKLDKLLRPDYRGKMLSELLNLWYTVMVRFKGLRTKIFLRDDIFRNEVNYLTDKIKLDNYKTKIEWDYDHLLAMVWKRMVESNETLKKVLLTALEWEGYSVPDKEGVGLIPRPQIDVNKVVLKCLIGEKMGKGNKGYVYNWIRSRLCDTNDQIYPRSILKLFAEAAEEELKSEKGTGMIKIIEPKSLEKSIIAVSKDRITDMGEEYPKYKKFFRKLSNFCPYFPVEENAFRTGLVKCGLDEENIKNDIDELKDIGILKEYQRKKSDAVRYHMNDIYLKGMELVRKGS